MYTDLKISHCQSERQYNMKTEFYTKGRVLYKFLSYWHNQDRGSGIIVDRKSLGVIEGRRYGIQNSFRPGKYYPILFKTPEMNIEEPTLRIFSDIPYLETKIFQKL